MNTEPTYELSPFGFVIAGLRLEREHWENDRETDPEFSDMMIGQIDRAIEILSNEI